MASPSSVPSGRSALQLRRLDRERRRRQARLISTLLLSLGVAFVAHQFLRQPEPNRMQQMARKLLPAAQAAAGEAAAARTSAPPAPSAPAR